MSAAGRTIASPINAAALVTGAKSFEANPIIGSPRLNRLGLHAARVSAAYWLAERRRQRLAHLVSAEQRAEFNRNGYVLRRDFLPSPLFRSLLRELAAFRADAREILQGGTLNRKIALDAETLRSVPSLREVLGSTEWKGLIRYVGARDGDPIVFLQSLFSGGPQGPVDPQTYLHADTFHPTVKAWLFLTDVAEDEGPFTYVPGSHRLTSRRLEWEHGMSQDARRSADRETREGSFRIAARELPSLGLPPPVALAVPANTLVVADTFGFHARGLSVRPSRRVELWAYGRRSPFMTLPAVDLWSSEALGRRVGLQWRLQDGLAARGLAPSSRKLRRAVTVFDPP